MLFDVSEGKVAWIVGDHTSINEVLTLSEDDGGS